MKSGDAVNMVISQEKLGRLSMSNSCTMYMVKA